MHHAGVPPFPREVRFQSVPGNAVVVCEAVSTSLILCQGTLNIFVVLGLAPLTGVPLPFISYAPSNLCIMLASVGLLLNLSRPGARRLKPVENPGRDSSADRDRRRRDRGARRSGAGGGRRAAG